MKGYIFSIIIRDLGLTLGRVSVSTFAPVPTAQRKYFVNLCDNKVPSYLVEYSTNKNTHVSILFFLLYNKSISKKWNTLWIFSPKCTPHKFCHNNPGRNHFFHQNLHIFLKKEQNCDFWKSKNPHCTMKILFFGSDKGLLFFKKRVDS